jgi:hypothetical protein
MEHLLLLYNQLREADEMIDLFYGQKIIQPTLDRMMRNRGKVIKRIQRIQIRTFNRE